MNKRAIIFSLIGVALLGTVSLVTWAQGKPGEQAQPEEQERQITEAELPAPAQAALKKLSGGAKITEYAEELKGDSKFYAAVRKLSGEGAALFCEKKTSILYEVKFRQDDQRHEILYAPDGRVLEKAVEKVQKAGDDQDD